MKDIKEKKAWLDKLLISGIEAIIFDLGGVIIDIDFNRTMQALSSFTTQQLGEGEYLGKHPIFYEFETGQISEIQFFTKMRQIFELNATIVELQEAWNALLLTIPQKRVDLLSQMQKNYRTFILSNTNPTHLHEVENILRRQTTACSLQELVYKAYYSFQIGKAKPEPAIYELIIKENRLIPEKTLFVDDNLRNIEAARNVGLQTLHITPFVEDICDFFSELSKKETK